MATSGASQAGSGGSSKSSFTAKRERPGAVEDGQSDNFLDRRSSLEYGIFGVLFTLSKERSEHRIRIRWVLLKILLDAWQLFTTIIAPHRQPWNINADGTAWTIVGVLNFAWLGDLGYGVYLAVLYAMLGLLAVNIVMCVWVAWCFKEHKFPVVWPIKVLRVFSSVFFQAFDVASLNLLQLGIMCRFNGPVKPHMVFDLFPEYSCAHAPHIMHAVVSALCLIIFVAIALLLNMAEVEVNPLSRRPMALGHSGAEVMSFAVKVLLTLVNVFVGWEKVEACVYLALSLALAWQAIRWNGHLVAWVNYLKAGVAAVVVWCSVALILLVFRPGVKEGADPVSDIVSPDMKKWSDIMTTVMIAGLAPAFGVGALLSWLMLRHMHRAALRGIENPKKLPISDAFSSIDEPRDVEIASRICRQWKEPCVLDPDAVNKAHQIIKAGLEMFPNSAFMVLLHADFMIDVLGVSQSGSRRIEDARKLNPGLMCRFIMFVRQQQATQNAAGSSVNSASSMDLLGYVEYQRKQRMVVRLHREALQAMCNFWKALDASSISFTHLSKSLGKIETSVSQAQRAYRVVLESYGNNPKLVHLYGRFLQTIKNDPWHAAEYFAEAERLEELQDSNASGPLMPDGTPLSRMDELDTAVLVLNAMGEVQMANRHTQYLFGYKRGVLEGKPLSTLLAPHFARRLLDRLTAIATSNELLRVAESPEEEDEDPGDEMVVGLHCERLAFPAKLCLRKASGVGEDSTIIALIEPVPPPPGVCSVWVTHNGIITACDPAFVANFGWKASEVNGTSIKNMVTFSAAPKASAEAGGRPTRPNRAISFSRARQNESASELVKRLLEQATELPPGTDSDGAEPSTAPAGLACLVPHKYTRSPLPCTLTIIESVSSDPPIVHELRIKVAAEPVQLLAVNRKGAILHASSDLAARLKDRAGHGFDIVDTFGPGAGGSSLGPDGGGLHPPHAAEGLLGDGAGEAVSAYTAALHGYTIFDFMSPAWKEMHIKLLKDITTVTPLPVSDMACRKSPLASTTMELRTAGGRELYMKVGISSTEIQGEVVHIIHTARSTLDTALGERRLRLRLFPDGLIAAVEGGNSSQLFGMDAGKFVGRALWELVEESTAPPPPNGRASNSSITSRSLAALINRALRHPGHSWRVQVVSPPSRARLAAAGAGDSQALTRSSFTSVAKPAIMQVQVVLPPDDDEDAPPIVFVDLWPVSTVVGVLELDQYGRVRAVLEEKTRPAGLLFGVPSQSLVGSMLGELVALPQGRTRPGDLLSLHGSKKSSLKSQAKDASVKVGPVHVFRATHMDARPLSLDVQVVGKPGSNEPATAILRVHMAPMMPRLLPAPQPSQTQIPAAVAAPPPPPPPLQPQRPITPSMGATVSPNLLTRGGSVGVAPAADGPAAYDATADALTPQRTPSLDDNRPRASSPWRAPSGAMVPPQQPPIIRALTTPPAAKTPSGPGMAPPETYSVGDWHPSLLGDTDALDGGADADYLNMVQVPDDSARGLLSVRAPASADTGARAGTPGRAPAALPGRSKLADMVKAVGDRGALSPPPRRGGTGGENAGMGVSMSGNDQLAGRGTTTSFKIPGTVPPDILDTVETTDVASGGGDALSEDGNSDDRRGTKAGAQSRAQTASRVLEWVASKGAFYQNSVNDTVKGTDRCPPSRDGRDYVGEDSEGYPSALGVPVPVLRPVSPVQLPKAGADYSVKGRGGGDDTTTAYEEEDAGSDGGQSAVSGAQSATGTEYTRGKRFRKLAKLMDSNQTQLVQKRLRSHALIVVAVLGIVHIICFVLTVTTIKQQQTSMLQLGRSGQAQLYMHRVMIDVRSLDIISRGKWKNNPNLYTENDTGRFVGRISRDADEIKVRFNDILNNYANSPDIISLLYQTKRTVWDTNDFDGSDIYTNLTIWDFTTRFYSMAKEMEQMHDTWVEEGEFISDTYAAQFLLKSGPDLFVDSRKILDALLFNAVDNARKIDILQIVFLLVEGAAISFMAACYLMFLLRAVAEQRFKLYSTFLVIPVGLTRALASQNTNLLVDDDDDEDGEEEDERAVQQVVQEVADEENAAPKLRRRATLKLQSSDERAAAQISSPVVASNGIGGGTPLVGGWAGRRVSTDAQSDYGRDDPSTKRPYADRYDKLRTMTADSVDVANTGCWGWLNWRSRLRHTLGRRSSILPMPHGNPLIAPSSSLSGSKRSLRFDSHETIVMLLPFIVWSALVITIYAVAVVWMKGVDQVVAVHSVVNFMAARTSRTVFFCQELANVDDPAQLPAKRAALLKVVKLIRDAWYTLQLGDQAYTAVGNATERFPLVRSGLSHASMEIANLFYGAGSCHRVKENLPCPGTDYRYYQVTRTGLDSMMQQLMISLSSMATNSSMVPEGLEDEHFDYVYNVGYKDLLDGTVKVAEAHYHTLSGLFNSILILHIILFLLFWVIFAGFMFFMLNPLLARVAQERRRIAELMSQLPLELDVEKLVAKALGTGGNGQNGASGDGDRSVAAGGGGYAAGTEPDATSKWKAIIRASSSLTAAAGRAPSVDGRRR